MIGLRAPSSSFCYLYYSICCDLNSSNSGIDRLSVVSLDLGDLALLEEVLAGSTGEGAVNLKALNKGGRSDELHLLSRCKRD